MSKKAEVFEPPYEVAKVEKVSTYLVMYPFVLSAALVREIGILRNLLCIDVWFSSMQLLSLAQRYEIDLDSLSVEPLQARRLNGVIVPASEQLEMHLHTPTHYAVIQAQMADGTHRIFPERIDRVELLQAADNERAIPLPGDLFGGVEGAAVLGYSQQDISAFTKTLERVNALNNLRVVRQ